MTFDLLPPVRAAAPATHSHRMPFRDPRRARRWLSAAWPHAAMISFCVGATPLAAQAPPSLGPVAPRAILAPTGPYRVGRQEFELVDSSRRDPVDSARARVVVGWIWYPAAPANGSGVHAERRPLERALPTEWGDLRATALAAKIGDSTAQAMKVIGVHAVTGAPWTPEVSRAPVLVFTPGNGWLPTDYSVLIEDLASHGYVVVGVAPAGLSDVVRLRNGLVIRKTLGNGAAIDVDQAHAHRDVLHVLSRLAELDSDPSAPWHDHLDLGRVGAFGHSLGGTTSLVAAASDTTVRAAVNLDGDAMGSVAEVRPRQPLLFVSSELPTMGEAPPARGPRWAELTRQGIERSERRRTGEWSRMSSRSIGATRLRLLGARHLDFTDAALASDLIDGLDRRWMRWGPIEGARALRITADVVRAFFDQALLGRPLDTLLMQPERGYPELRLVPATTSADDAAPHLAS